MSLSLQFLALQARLARLSLFSYDGQSDNSLQYSPNAPNKSNHRNPPVNVQRARFSLQDLLKIGHFKVCLSIGFPLRFCDALF